MVVWKSVKDVSRMLKGNFKVFQGRLIGEWWFKGALRVSKRSSNGVSREFQGTFKDILKKYQRCFKKISKQVSRVFQECFIEVLFCNFVVAWISSQLPKQKEGLFYLEFGLLVKNKWMHLFFNLSPLSPISWSPSLLQNWVSVCIHALILKLFW